MIDQFVKCFILIIIFDYILLLNMDSPNFAAEFNAKLRKFIDRMRHMEKTGEIFLTQRQEGMQ